MQKYLAFLVFFLFSLFTYLIGSKSLIKQEAAIVQEDIGLNDKVKSVSQRLRSIDNKPISQRIEVYYQLKEDSLEFYNFENEDELTMYGYSLLWSNQIDDAVVFFQLLVDEFPQSANTYDSLGEAYLAQGNEDLSLKNYRKSLAMNPDNFFAEDQIAKILDPNFKEINPKDKFSKVYKVGEYESDLDLLGQKLLSTHPNALKFIDSLSFMALIEEKKKLIRKETKFADFDTYCLEIIASLNCSHTSAGSFDRPFSMIPKELLFPIKVQLIKDKLYVTDPLNNKAFLNIKDQILSINNVKVEDLIKNIYTMIPSQGYVETKKRHSFNTWANLLISKALQYPETFKVKVKGIDSSIFLNRNTKIEGPNFEPTYPICEENLCLKYHEEGKVAVMTISSFNYYPWNNLAEFENFVDRSFNEFILRGTRDLIIDLRNNGGGSPESSIHLLRYLIPQTFTYFKNSEYRGTNENFEPMPLQFQGQVYFLIDGNGNSTTGHFMSMVKKHNLGTIVGEELGSNHFCTAGQFVLRLPNTRLVYYVANATSITDVEGLPDERGILPDYYVDQNIEDYLNRRDAVKNFTFDLIHAKMAD